MPTVAFPALQVAPRDSFAVVPAIPVEATVEAISAGYFDGLYLVDSKGLLFRVASAAPAKPPTWLDRFMNRRIPVALSFDEPVPADLKEVVTDLLALIDQDPDDLYSDHQTLKARIREMGSPAELVASLKASAA